MTDTTSNGPSEAQIEGWLGAIQALKNLARMFERTSKETEYAGDRECDASAAVARWAAAGDLMALPPEDLARFIREAVAENDARPAAARLSEEGGTAERGGRE